MSTDWSHIPLDDPDVVAKKSQDTMESLLTLPAHLQLPTNVPAALFQPEHSTPHLLDGHPILPPANTFTHTDPRHKGQVSQ